MVNVQFTFNRFFRNAQTPMKKFFSSLALASLVFSAVAQVKVNPKAEEAFKDRHKKAKDVVWAETDKGYSVSFENDGYAAMAEFEKNGKWVKSETEVTEELLMVDFLNKVYTKYPDAYIPKVVKRETPEGTTFEVVLDDDGKAYTYSVDEKGKVLAATGAH